MSTSNTSAVWWRDGVIYQIYPRSFQDSNGDGVGDLNGITARLDYLAALGVDALWLSPIYPSPMFDFGYDVSDYEAIDPVFGTLADFDRLVTEAHARGLRLILDLVFNHTSHLHPWFLESRSSRDNPKRDWYLWRDPAPDGSPPNNWESVFGGRGWQLDAATGQYYYHQFLKEQPDLNWRNPAVRARLHQVMRFWLDRGVDGFRLDVTHAFFKDDQFRDNPPAVGLRGWDRQRHVYDQDRPELLTALSELRRLLDSYPERMAVGEVDTFSMATRYSGPEALHLAFNFDFLRQPWLPRPFQQAVQRYEAALPAGAWPCYVLGNHDVDRFPTRFGGGPHADARSKVAAALLLTQRGTPFLYYGEELGMQNAHIPREEIQDPPGKRYWPVYVGRDPERTPMQWDAGPNAGFSTGRPWLRLHPDYPRRNVAAQLADADSVLSFYQELLRLRRRAPALRSGAFQPLVRRPVEATAYLRVAPNQTLLVALNFFGWETTLKLSTPLPAGAWQVRLSTTSGNRASVSASRLTLAPFEVSIYERIPPA